MRHLTCLTEPGIATSEPIEIKDAANLSVPCSSNWCLSTDESSSDTAEGVLDDEQPLRKWCTGQPPKKSFLGAGRSAKLPFMRRSTLADKPELDVLLALTKKSYKGHSYLPLTAHTIRRLSPFWKGEKQIADTTIFDCVMIDHEINGVHADHVVAALERIGTFCKHLLVMSGVKTSELGTVFNRESGNVTPGNDWDCILSCFPNLKHLVFIHPVEEPIELSRGTLLALHLAIAKRQGTQEMMRFGVDVPAKLITHLTPDMASYHSNNSN
jgi:hypothetical protein